MSKALSCPRLTLGATLAASLFIGTMGTASAQSWTRVASEWQRFTVTGTQTVRFGAGTRWATKTMVGTAFCQASTFGGDPAPNTAKQCDVLTSAAPTPAPAPVAAAPAPSASTGWSKVADEWQNFSVSGTQRVRFGANSGWVERSLSGTQRCQASTFGGGDPAPNVAKQCQVASSGGTASPAPAPVASPSPAPAPAATSASVLKPFSSGSPWKTPIPSNATYAPSWDSRVQAFQNVNGRLSVNVTQYTQWVFVARSSDPMVNVNVQVRNLPGAGGTSDSVNRAGTVTLRMPSNAAPDVGTDKHMTIISEDGRWAHEFWYAYRDGGGWKAVAYARVDLYGDGTMISGEGVQARMGAYHNPNVVSYGWGATRAYGGSSLAGLIRAGEVTSGSIDHALYISLPHNLLRMPPAGQLPVFPASRNDTSAGYDPSHIIMGTRLAIPRSVNVEAQGFSPAALKLARALQTYGAYVLDQSSVPVLNSDGVAAQADGRALASQMGDMAKIHSLLTIVN